MADYFDFIKKPTTNATANPVGQNQTSNIKPQSQDQSLNPKTNITQPPTGNDKPTVATSAPVKPEIKVPNPSPVTNNKSPHRLPLRPLPHHRGRPRRRDRRRYHRSARRHVPQPDY